MLKYVLYSISYEFITPNGVIAILSKDFDVTQTSESSCRVETEFGSICVEYVNGNALGDHAIVISVNSMGQELVCSAWDILLNIFNEYEGTVWLSTYSADYLSRFGPVTEVIVAGVPGQAIDCAIFNRMIT
jgi:hypothetical protein